MRWIMLAVAFALSGTAQGQTMRDSTSPASGVETVASVGEPVFERSHLSVVPAYEILEGFNRKNVFARVIVAPGTKFMAVESKAKLKACAAPTLEAFSQKLYSACVYDDDLDGTFDRFGANEVQGGKKLTPPIPYKASEYVQPTSDSVKQVIIFLGSTKDSLRLSYREFVNDMARPAFTEEYTFPLGDTYPQVVAFKDVKLNVTGIDGEGIHYSVK